MSALFSKCKCSQPLSNIQEFEQFTNGRQVGFTDAYHKQFAGKDELAFHDWIVADRNKEGRTITIQRHGMPQTKFALGLGWVYLK